jgi:hypothetical protein
VADSSALGYLVPATSSLLEDAAFEDFLAAVVSGVTGMTPNAISPRWQVEPQVTPDVGSDWAALGVMRFEPDAYAVQLHEAPSPGDDQLLREERLEVLCSFYGPGAWKNAGLLRDGLQIEQNRETMKAAAIAAGFAINLVESGEPIFAPMLEKSRWLRRVDQPLVMVRQVRRTYSVFTLASSQGTIATENLSAPIASRGFILDVSVLDSGAALG